MNVTFRLRFSTRPGQSLWLVGTHPLPGHPVPLQYVDAEFWQVTVPLTTQAAGATLNYSYILRQTGDAQTTDWGRNRRLVPARFNGAELLVIDSWNQAGFFENAFYTEPFKKVLLAENLTEVKTIAPQNPTHTFRIKAPLLVQGQTICLLGAGAVLGHWNTQPPILLSRTNDEDYFSVQLDLRGQPFPFAYKYGVFDVEKKSFVRFEGGGNRSLKASVVRNQHTVVNDGFVVLPADTWHGTGVAVPVFSLRSGNSFGVGEFLDLKPLAGWGKKAGLKLIQLLPVNDTSATSTWKDSYPYAAISAFALHPIYLNLAAVASPKNQKLLKQLEPERQRLNALDTLDYEAVMKAKLGFLKQIFPSQKTTTFRSQKYKKFFAENEHWLAPYAAFCFLRDKFGTPDFSRWPEHREFNAGKISALAAGNDDVAFHFFLQFHLHRQLQEATAHAHGCGLVVKGDIAIGVYRHSADVWQSPELFNLDMQAGAPPDAFAAKGQNWGFPTYNWPRMAADGFAWWKQRFAQMGNYFDAFRIDHILGFFRIWSSPAHAVEGILGHFVPAIAIEPVEFAARGIVFDHERFTKPFITDAVLHEILGNENKMIRREFLSATGNGNYSLKPKFATQRQVENHFATREQNERNGKLKIGLFDLVSNVILFEVEGKYHFRFAMEQTVSFKNLPPDMQAKLRDLYVDYFFRRQDDFWRREAMQKLPALKRVTNMLVCGEDLGLVPACVPEVMRDLGLLSLEIQRMPKTSGVDFSRPADAPYLSVVTPSTHDMSTIRGWWEENRELTQKFFNRELGLPGEAPREASPEIVEAVVRQHLTSPAMWSIFQLQDLLGMDVDLRRAGVEAERINVPAIPDFYWRYRLHLTLEKLLRAEKFNSHLSQLLRKNGR
ncbi:MAG TPA: 4-alpha-glucanotransferase [Verrucomicrobia subdivision 3 bacterium]|nr:4-alpha-glucanotransferase [Limisphaerales bacterium]